GKPRQLETEAELYDIAVRALMRRAHSIHEMKQKLEHRSDNKLLVQVVMARLKENGMIDDARYAKQFARQRTESRKQGKYRVARDTVFSLLAGFGALAGKLFGVPRVVHQAVFFQARHHYLHQQLVVAAALQLLLHFVDGVRPPH